MKNFSQPESLAGAVEVPAHQLDPQSMADVIKEVVPAEPSEFPNVHPKETEESSSGSGRRPGPR